MARDIYEQERDRLLKLEELLAHQAKTIEEMSQALARQWDQMDAMRRKLDALTERFLVLEEAATPDHPITKPPHY